MLQWDMDYYAQKQFLAAVDRDDNIVGKVEKWEAHKKGILHRGYTAILTYSKEVVLQHRKHPVFDDVFDLSFSSHQLYVNGTLQSDRDAIMMGLEREWDIREADLAGQPQFLKKVYYEARDPKSGYTEHEIDYIYRVELKRLPEANNEYAYGQKTYGKENVPSITQASGLNLAPWVAALIREKAY